jgi:hypothetical protein
MLEANRPKREAVAEAMGTVFSFENRMQVLGYQLKKYSIGGKMREVHK